MIDNKLDVSDEIRYESSFEPKQIDTSYGKDQWWEEIVSPQQEKIIDRLMRSITSAVLDPITTISHHRHARALEKEIMSSVEREKRFFVCEYLYRQKRNNQEDKEADALLSVMKKVVSTPLQYERYQEYADGHMPTDRLQRKVDTKTTDA